MEEHEVLREDNRRLDAELVRVKARNQTTLSLIQEENESLREERDKYQASLSDKRTELASLQGKLDEAYSQIADLKRALIRAQDLTSQLQPEPPVQCKAQPQTNPPPSNTLLSNVTRASSRQTTPRMVPYVSVLTRNMNEKNVHDRPDDTSTSGSPLMNNIAKAPKRRRVEPISPPAEAHRRRAPVAIPVSGVGNESLSHSRARDTEETRAPGSLASTQKIHLDPSNKPTPHRPGQEPEKRKETEPGPGNSQGKRTAIRQRPVQAGSDGRANDAVPSGNRDRRASTHSRPHRIQRKWGGMPGARFPAALLKEQGANVEDGFDSDLTEYEYVDKGSGSSE